ncbi:MAG TPA: hypothetical protein VGO31_00305 [Microbacteriaceae bacterium]|jgi:hypothetical protein|nr:hypothetical protein [Microbacteriaceae bacterium]
MGDLQTPNTILLPCSAPFMREVIFPDGERGAAVDASFLQFLVEELIAHSVARLAVDPNSLFYRSVGGLPSVLRERIIEVDSNLECLEKAAYVLDPVFCEIGVDFEERSSDAEQHDVEFAVGALRELGWDFHRFLVGQRHHVQVGLAPEQVMTRIDYLLGVCHEPEARAVLASIAGIFNSYVPLDVPSLTWRSQASPELAQQFARFVENQTYVRMSEAAGLLGIPARMTHGLIRMRRFAADLIARPAVSDVMDLSAASVGTASHLPLPSAKTMRGLLTQSQYIPPLLALEDTELRAADRWRTSDAPVLPLAAHSSQVRAMRLALEDDEAASTFLTEWRRTKPPILALQGDLPKFAGQPPSIRYGDSPPGPA